MGSFRNNSLSRIRILTKHLIERRGTCKNYRGNYNHKSLDAGDLRNLFKSAFAKALLVLVFIQAIV